MRFFRAVVLAATLCFVPFCSGAQEETFATCRIPDGAEFVYLSEASSLEAPEGLEKMYEFMMDANELSDVYIIRMPNGRALASISCTSGVEPGTAQDLRELWPKVTESIVENVYYVTKREDCVSVEMAFGYEALVIHTNIAPILWNEDMLLKAYSVAFYNGTDFIEIWALYPVDSVYLYDPQATAELQSDLEALDAFMDSLSFPSK